MGHLTTHKHRESGYLRAYKAPLHLSRILYKSTLFMQNKPKVKYVQIIVSSFITSIYVKMDTW